MSVAFPSTTEGTTLLSSGSMRIAPVGKRLKPAWQPLQIDTTSVMIRGGHTGTKPVPVDVIEYMMENKKYQWFHLSKKEKWFQICTAGWGSSRYDFSNVFVVKLIREQFFGDDGEPAVAAMLEDDPMNKLGLPLQPEDSPSKAKRDGVATLQMPKRPPCSGVDKGETVEVHVVKPGKNTSLYIRRDCVDWLLAFAADEYSFANIVREASPEVQDYTLEWDFQKCQYIACVVHDGRTSRMAMGLKDLTNRIWNFLKQHGWVEGYLSKVSAKAKKEACREFCARWAQAMYKGDAQAFDDVVVDDAKKKEESQASDAPVDDAIGAGEDAQVMVDADDDIDSEAERFLKKARF